MVVMEVGAHDEVDLVGARTRGGQPVEAAMPFTNDSVSLELRLDIPKEQTSGTFSIGVQARGAREW